MRHRCIYIALLISTILHAQTPLRIVSYNVENLFHPAHDSVNGEPKNDLEWTPEGKRQWTYRRYYNKVENIARVLTLIGEWDGVDIIGLCEIENALVVKRLAYTLRRDEYDLVHYESPDQRGIDVAFLYKKSRIDTLRSRAIAVRANSSDPDRQLITRDILYLCARVHHVPAIDTLHLFMCHLPSQRGGAKQSAWKRQLAKSILQQAIDSVLDIHPQAHIIVMGDMNSAPQQDLRGLNNRMIGQSRGTHFYKGEYTCLDQFYTSPALDSISAVSIYDAPWIMEQDEQTMLLKPKRTYNGIRYLNGYSDHLPIILRIY